MIHKYISEPTDPPPNPYHQNVQQLLEDRINELILKHGGLRAAARALRFDVAHLSRIRDGIVTNPTDAVLKRLGLRRTVIYTKTGK